MSDRSHVGKSSGACVNSFKSGSRYSVVGEVLVAIVFLLVAGCSEKCASVNFKGWENADRVVVTKASKTTLKALSDRSTISRIAAFAQSRSSEWATPLAGTPVAPITVEFYSGGQFLGHLGVGESFIESQGCGAFVSRKLGSADRSEIVGLLGISEADLAE
jgi:hypothetical protein